MSEGVCWRVWGVQKLRGVAVAPAAAQRLQVPTGVTWWRRALEGEAPGEGSEAAGGIDDGEEEGEMGEASTGSSWREDAEEE